MRQSERENEKTIKEDVAKHLCHIKYFIIPWKLKSSIVVGGATGVQ